ncbi:MAG: type IV pilin protein [Pseudomonadota bacterium]
MNHKQSGVTLIEVMIAVIIVGILSAVAVPNFMAYLAQAARAEARGILMENAQFLERNYSVANRFDEDASGAATDLPFDQSPKEGTAKYNISTSVLTATTYTLQAVPTGSMAGDECGTLTLNHLGDRGSAGTLAECWEH